jgi:hypothetical protein
MSIKKLLLVIILIMTLGFLMQPVFAANLRDAFGQATEDPLYSAAKQSGYDTKNSAGSVEIIIGQVIQAVLSLLGVIFLILMIYGGFTWMKAMGNETEVTKAKNILSAAVIGLLIVMGAYAISFFIIKSTSDAAGLKVDKTTDESGE